MNNVCLTQQLITTSTLCTLFIGVGNFLKSRKRTIIAGQKAMILNCGAHSSGLNTVNTDICQNHCMRKTFFILLFSGSFAIGVFGQQNQKKGKSYVLIEQYKGSNSGQFSYSGEINEKSINNLPEPLRALAAYYSGLGGSECLHDSCNLTIALGLGKQGSDNQIKLISKWFKNDSAAKILILGRCYQPPDGASTFSNYTFLNFTLNGNIVTVNYLLMSYDHGTYYETRGPDKYEIKDKAIVVLKRNIWSDLLGHRN